MKREQIISTARKYKGKVRWQHQQRGAEGDAETKFADCLGFISLVSSDLGLSIDYESDYERTPQGEKLYHRLKEVLIEKPLEQLKPGDVVLMEISGLLTHVGIIGERKGVLSLIHNDNRPGVRQVVEVTYPGLFERLTKYAFTIPGTID